MKKNITLLLLLVTLCGFAQMPKREFRASWVATVTNLDWPSSRSLTTEQQKTELIAIFDRLKAANINVVVFQVRTESDALYNSPYEPWSYWLTNQQGKAPNPYYDPLEMAVDEAHKRGMELHAWFNPYRAERTVGNYTTDPNHVTNKNPEMVLQIGTFKFMNPGLPEVRAHVAKVVSDVVRRYDIDGIHMDDYFYPYPPSQITTQDTATFRLNGRGIADIKDWRRDNVNILIKQLSDSVKTLKPWVKFGMSPFGIWRPGNPAGITGLDAYNDIYCDALAWMRNKSVDYITPQLYWPFGAGQDYGSLANWWADSAAVYNVHFYPGMAPYRLTTWTASEIHNQIRWNRGNAKIGGEVFFRAGTFKENLKGFVDSLKKDLFRFPSLPPKMNWKDIVPPNPVTTVIATDINATTLRIDWKKPSVASDGDTARFYAIYQVPVPGQTATDIEKAEYLYGVVQGNTATVPQPKAGFTYIVTALDRNWNESAPERYLPVELTSFAATVVGDEALLSWSTASEINNKGFSIEKSLDGVSFKEISFVAGIGTTNEIHYYQYSDKLEGKSVYYRLKQVDFDGSYIYTSTVKANSEVPVEFSLAQNFPNPFNPSTTISYSIPQSGNVVLKIYNITGVEIATLVNENKEQGTYTFELDASAFASGVYIYTLQSGSNILSRKMTLIK